MNMVTRRLAEIPAGSRAARQSRQAGLRQATLAILIVLIVQFALGMAVNLYVALPAARAPARLAGGLDRQNARREGRRRPRHRWVQGVLAFIVVGRVGWW